MDGSNSKTNPATSKGKGKGSEERAQANEPENGTRPSSSFTTRLTESAAHLTRSLLTSPPERDDITRLLSSSSKTEAPSSIGPVVGESSSTAASILPRRTAGATGASYNTKAAAETFRSSQADEHAVQAELEFSNFLNDTSVFVPSAPAAEQLGGLETEPAAATWGRDRGDHIQAPVADSGRGQDTGLSIAEQEARDGLEVSALLNSFDAGERETAMDDDMPLSDADAAALRQALFESPGTAYSLSWDNALNFIPDFIRPDPGDTGHVHGQARVSNPAKSAESLTALGLPHGPEAERAWLDSWQDALIRYHDEVWGDLGPLVKQAVEELRELQNVKPGAVPPETKAIQRLQQILGHIRGGS